MIELQLPWPPSDLSPNKRLHWARLAKVKKLYRKECMFSVLAQNIDRVPDGSLTLDLTFVPPTRRSYDRDNLVARMKSGLDGLADALKIDDKRFTTLAARVSTDTIGGFVRVRIFQEQKE